MSQRSPQTSTARPSTARRLLGFAVIPALVPLFAASIVRAQPANEAGPAVTPEIESSQYSFVGEVNADGALVRSGPSESDYAVLKLAKGARLTVVGMRFDWLKIEPPQGSYCIVPQAFVNKRGDGSVGRIAGGKATVRIGSTLSQSRHRVPIPQLEPGTEVTILDEEAEFYRIAPPPGVFMYIDKRFVNPVRRADANGILTPPTVAEAPQVPEVSADGTLRQTAQPIPGADTALPPGVATADPSPADPNRFDVKSDIPSYAEKSVAEVARQAETIRKLQERLSQLEDRYAAAGQKELSQQPIDELLKEYNELLADQQLPPNARKVAEFRAQQLNVRQEALVQYLAAQKLQEEMAQKQKDLKAEQEELQQIVVQTEVKRYAAVGRLVPSSLQIGNQTLYRLVDPANSRLIVYVRTAQVPVGDAVNQFIGVNGQVIEDHAMNLTYVQPESYEPVDPRQVNTRIFAEYSPPSLAVTNVAGEPPTP